VNIYVSSDTCFLLYNYGQRSVCKAGRGTFLGWTWVGERQLVCVSVVWVQRGWEIFLIGRVFALEGLVVLKVGVCFGEGFPPALEAREALGIGVMVWEQGRVHMR
jgi:hypothetical protein